MTTTRTLSLRAVRAKSTLPMQTSPRTLPATRMTKRSLNPCPKSISVGTRASEQPTTTANGACFGISPCVLGMPTSRPLQGTTYCGSPCVRVRFRQLSIHWENILLPFSRSRRLRVSRQRLRARVARIESIYIVDSIQFSGSFRLGERIDGGEATTQEGDI